MSVLLINIGCSFLVSLIVSYLVTHIMFVVEFGNKYSWDNSVKHWLRLSKPKYNFNERQLVLWAAICLKLGIETGVTYNDVKHIKFADESQ